MTEIRPSPELLAITRRFLVAIRDGRTDSLEQYFLDGEALRFIGTAENEYWSGRAVRSGIGAFYGVLQEFLAFEEVHAEAFEMGHCGWASFQHRIQFAPMESPDTYRTTFVFVLDGANWKIVQRHASIPNDGLNLIGVVQDGIQRLVDAAQDGFALTQREGLASVMFTDVVSSSALAEAMGDAAWSQRISAHFAAVRQVVGAAGGQFVKSLGDGTLASFPSARAALQAAVRIQRDLDETPGEPRLTLRIGIHTGDVVQAEDDFFGTVVNKAARITAVAGPGRIAVSEATRAMVGSAGDFVFTEPSRETLRGFEGEHTVFRLEWSR